MNEEEKKAIGLLKALNNTEEKCKIEKIPYNSEIKRIKISLLPEDYGVFRTLLNLIEKFQQENEELKRLIAHKSEYTKKLEEDLFGNCSNYVIPIQKVKDKIEELNNKPLKINENNKYYYETDAYNRIIIQVLQELIKEGE